MKTCEWCEWRGDTPAAAAAAERSAAIAAVEAATAALIHTARRDAERARCSAGMMAAVERLDAAEARLREVEGE